MRALPQHVSVTRTRKPASRVGTRNRRAVTNVARNAYMVINRIVVGVNASGTADRSSRSAVNDAHRAPRQRGICIFSIGANAAIGTRATRITRSGIASDAYRSGKAWQIETSKWRC